MYVLGIITKVISTQPGSKASIVNQSRPLPFEILGFIARGAAVAVAPSAWRHISFGFLPLMQGIMIAFSLLPSEAS
jgi:hypothetical protein